MKIFSHNASRWLTVVIYATAMAWVESAVVFYLRTMVDRIDPYQPNPLPVIGKFGIAEVVREAATLVMLLTVGILAGRTWRSRLGYAALAFGVWDIFYYVFLKVICGWPRSLLDWDILFLIPMPWWGPVLAPISIALLLIVWGTLASGREMHRFARSNWNPWLLNLSGICLALYLFMADNLRLAGRPSAWRDALPIHFNWLLFAVALSLMAAPIAELLWRRRLQLQDSRPAFDCAKWLQHFSRNRQHRSEPDWSCSINLPPNILRPLRRSLAEFQLGDGGGPASLIARDADRFRCSSAQMRDLVDLWFTEEREHSRLLGCAVDRLGATRISSHWSFTAFCLCRRVMGVGFELKVLLLTEITSTAYYRLLQRHSPLVPLRAMCGLILRDEGGHVAFHRDRLAAAGRSPNGLKGRLFAAQFCFFGYAAATMLWVNHGTCLRRLGATTAEFYREVGLELTRFLKRLAAQHLKYAFARSSRGNEALTSPLLRSVVSIDPPPVESYDRSC